MHYSTNQIQRPSLLQIKRSARLYGLENAGKWRKVSAESAEVKWGYLDQLVGNARKDKLDIYASVISWVSLVILTSTDQALAKR